MNNVMLWNIKSLMCNKGVDNGFSFDLWVSPRFLRIAETIELDEEIKKRFQETARTIIKEAGFKHILGSEEFLKFGRFGLEVIDVPGNASGIYIDWSETTNIFEGGAEFVSYNIDDPLQQSTLIKIWLFWAKFIELKIEKEKHYPKTIARFKQVLINKNPGVIPEQQEDRNSPSHLLWMLDEIEKGNFSFSKASRWIGWIACSIYSKGLLNSEEIDELIRKDV